MKSEGYVLSLDGAYAVVRLFSADACTGCKLSCFGCGERTVRVKNARNASVGDIVTVVSLGNRLPLYAALLFLLPLAAFGACYLIVSLFDTGAVPPYLAAALGFFLTLFLLPRVFRKKGLAGELVMLERDPPPREQK